MPISTLSIRLRAGLLIALTLCSSGFAAAQTKVPRLVATPAAFELCDVVIACDLTIDSRDEAPERTIDYRYRLRVLGRDAATWWDSGWRRATGLRGRRLRPQPMHVAARLDTASAQALSVIWIEVAVEVDGRVDTPTRFAFFRWADGRFRAFPEPSPWPERVPPAPSDEVLSSPPGVSAAQMLGATIPSERRPKVPRVSWGHLKTHYR